MEWLIWVLIAIVIGFLKNLKNGGFPKLPDGRNDTPLGPTGHREWPPKPPVFTEQPPVPRLGQPMTTGRPGGGAEGQGQVEGRSEYETRGPVSPTLREPHETVHTTLNEPHESVREMVQVPTSNTERAFSGQSSYDRIGSHPVGRPFRRQSPFSMQKEDLVRAVVMAEILGPPRARNPRQGPGNWRKR